AACPSTAASWPTPRTSTVAAVPDLAGCSSREAGALAMAERRGASQVRQPTRLANPRLWRSFEGWPGGRCLAPSQWRPILEIAWRLDLPVIAPEPTVTK